MKESMRCEKLACVRDSRVTSTLECVVNVSAAGEPMRDSLSSYTVNWSLRRSSFHIGTRLQKR